MVQRILQVNLALAVISACVCLRLSDLGYRNCSDVLFNTPSMDHGSFNETCPPWFFSKNGKCWPGPTLGGIIKHDLQTLQTSLLQCNCMTEENGVLTVGACIYTCKAVMGYYPLPCHVSQMQKFTCAGLHRHGKLCDRCENGYAIPVYSYSLACVKCTDYKYNWLRYLTVAFLPLTLFYIVVTLFSISFTHPLLAGMVTTFQIIAQPIQLQLFLSFMKSFGLVQHKILRALLSFASFWNLDFFRMYYSFCLHPDASAMAIMALDYATTVYPVVLIGVTYVMVKLYDDNFKLLVWPWKLLSAILKPLRKTWNVKTSLIDAFASFIYLSSTRLLLTSLGFLVPIKTYTYQQGPDGEMELTAKYYLFLSPSSEYFGERHLPFALLAITLLLVFYLLPIILLFVYPFSWFQNLLNKSGLNSLTLRIFVDVFQGALKDGTNGTRDYRHFSAFFLFIPLILSLTFSLTQSSIYYPIANIWILLYLTLHLIFRPYKISRHNYTTALILVALLVSHWGITINSEVTAVNLADTLMDNCHVVIFHGVWFLSIVMIGISIIVLLFYILGLLSVLIIFRCNKQKHAQ